jgi:hypothetical protein
MRATTALTTSTELAKPRAPTGCPRIAGLSGSNGDGYVITVSLGQAVCDDPSDSPVDVGGDGTFNDDLVTSEGTP